MLSGLCVAALTKVSSTVCGFGRGLRGRKGGKGPQVRGSGDELGQTGTQAGWSLSVPWSVRASLSVCSELAPEPAHIQGGPWNPCVPSSPSFNLIFCLQSFICFSEPMVSDSQTHLDGKCLFLNGFCFIRLLAWF